MTRWRAKRRYEANRRFGESADDALVAISILKGEQEGIDLNQSNETLTTKLRRGRELLESIRDAIAENPAVDPYKMAIASKLVDDDPNPPSRIVANLDDMIAALTTAEETLTYSEDLVEVRDWLKRISETASRTSRDSITRMRGSLADGAR